MDPNADSAVTSPFTVIVSGRSVVFADPTPTGSEILAKARFEPADDHVLIEMARVGSRMVSLDERVTLRRDEPARFFAFRTGEVFTFTVNEHGFQWGHNSITEPELRDFARVSNEDVLVLERDNHEPRFLGPADKVELRAPGTEHLRTEKHLVKLFIDNVAKEIPRGVYTTEQLIVVLEVKPGYLLDLAEKDGLKPLKPGQRIHVKDGMRFFSQVPGGGAA
ncbi:MAG: multiubiquitin domain-containing protein [Candidatus Binataceae bacterium]